MNKTTAFAIFAIFIVLSSISLSFFVFSIDVEEYFKHQRYYRFELVLPEEVNATPGEDIIIQGGIRNTGIWWLHKFNLTLTGLPYDYTIDPSYFRDVKILRDWNPINGTYRVPVPFNISISLSDDATGVHFINVTGKEYWSRYKASDSAIVILKVISPVEVKPNITISNIEIPEEVFVDKAFTINFTVNNFEEVVQNVTVSIDIPEDWVTLAKEKFLTLEPGSSQEVLFGVWPSKTSGTITINLQYPFKATIVNITKVGPTLVPLEEKPELPINISNITVPEVKPKEPWLSPTAFVNFVKNLSPIVVIILVLILIILIWNILKFYRFFKRRKKPESMKK